MKFRITKEVCYGDKPVYRAQHKVLGLFWKNCWYNDWAEAGVTYATREQALAAIEKFKLGCVTTVEEFA